MQIINPFNGRPLEKAGDCLADGDGNRFPIVAGVPRICEIDNYTGNFGLQWNRFDRTQLDDAATGLRESERRFFTATGWAPAELEGLDVLEVGSGAGRFSKVVLETTGARLWSVDYSSAVEANCRLNGAIAPDRFRLFQANIYDLPFKDGSFDRVFCFGVLQHTPDFEASVAALIAKAKPGGLLAVDFYPIRHVLTKLHAKYLLRPVAKRIKHEKLLDLIERNAGWLLAASDGVRRLHLGALARFVPIADARTFPEGLSREQRREWAVLDTFDWFSPEYDNPQRIREVAGMFERHGARVTFADYVDVGTGSAAVVRAVKQG